MSWVSLILHCVKFFYLPQFTVFFLFNVEGYGPDQYWIYFWMILLITLQVVLIYHTMWQCLPRLNDNNNALDLLLCFFFFFFLFPFLMFFSREEAGLDSFFLFFINKLLFFPFVLHSTCWFCSPLICEWGLLLLLREAVSFS